MRKLLIVNFLVVSTHSMSFKETKHACDTGRVKSLWEQKGFQAERVSLSKVSTSLNVQSTSTAAILSV